MNKEAFYGVQASGNLDFVVNSHSFHFEYLHERLFDILPGLAEYPSVTSVLSNIPEHAHEKLLSGYNRLLSGEATGSIQIPLHIQNTERWFRVYPFLHYQNDLLFVQGFIEEITAEIENKEVLTKYANKKNSILHMLAHDLRGPLGVGKSLLKTLSDTRNDSGTLAKTANVVNILEQSIELIDDLINREFLDSIAVSLLRTPMDLVLTLTEYIEECKRSMDVTSRVFTFECSSPTLFIDLDNAKFMQVINNLISNALKFTTDGGNIRFQLKDFTEYIELSVSDDGIGIPAELLPHIFEKFTPAKRTGLKGQPTLGLGLSIVKTLIEWHNGSITCQSKEGKGTTFIIIIPKAAAG